ncbi:sulfurtransferase TusA family protein [Gymnodinialimonas sp. 57CJ19]|uniref:sulfurtransferase TusA family protein n=1 Tax=Gymnodinialimonas sp. 57CJ19 TaxID=3138498 RepID=UPI003134369B
MPHPYAAYPLSSRGRSVTFPWTPPDRGPIHADMIDIDARDLLCPLPVLRLRKALEASAPGTTLRLLATDPAALIDVPHFCAEQGHSLLSATEIDESTTAYTVQKSA